MISEKPLKQYGYIDADFLFFCPGCKCHHGVWTTEKNMNKVIWQFNGDLQKPTVSPSILVRWADNVCHSFIKSGMIEFLSDCTHELKGTTVPLPQI